MNVLAMDCSGPVGSVAVVSGGAVVFDRSFPCPRGRGGAVFQALADAVDVAGAVDRIVVGTGPGSYNGLRVTAAAGEGMAAALGAARVGVLSVAALDGGSDFFAVGDARGGTFYCIRVRHGHPDAAVEVVGPDDLLSRLAAAPSVPVLVPAEVGILPNARVTYPSAVRLAQIGSGMPEVARISPVYAKPVHITPPRVTSRLYDPS